MQMVVRKVTFATLQTTNVLLQNASGSTNSNLVTQSVDVVALLGHVNIQLAQFPREQIKPALKQEYSTIYSAEVPLTSQYLFGDELAKQLRDARESSKTRQSLGHSSQRRPYTGNHSSGHHEHYNKGPKRDFLWKDLTNDRVILSDVLGASFELSPYPSQYRLPGHAFNEHENSVVYKEIQKLLQKGVIMKVKYSPCEIASGILLFPKKDGTFRLILDLKRFNEFVTPWSSF